MRRPHCDAPNAPDKCRVYGSHTRPYVDFSWDSVAQKNLDAFGVNVPLWGAWIYRSRKRGEGERHIVFVKMKRREKAATLIIPQKCSAEAGCAHVLNNPESLYNMIDADWHSLLCECEKPGKDCYHQLEEMQEAPTCVCLISLCLCCAYRGLL